jgi:hypothetical protein
MAETIRPLFHSSLPVYIVVDEIFGKHLYKSYSPLNEDQKESIVCKHFLFKKILMKYYHMYEGEQVSNMKFLNMLDNDLFLAINEGNTFDIKSKYLEEHLEIVHACMLYVPEDRLSRFVYDVWCMLDSEKKTEVYEYLINR